MSVCSVCKEGSCSWFNRDHDGYEDETAASIFKEDKSVIWEIEFLWDFSYDNYEGECEHTLCANLEDKIGLDVMKYFSDKHERLEVESHPLVKLVYPLDQSGTFKEIILFKHPLSFDEICCVFNMDINGACLHLLSGVNIFDLDKTNRETDRKAAIEMVEIIFKSILHNPDAVIKKIKETKELHDAASALLDFSNSPHIDPD